ncbi:hypothetical protein IWW48_001678 [Coemansia sp. RSA 1200]|nr:hypothetical protein IWW48_001678 [Coemansia sp. RSA 1200]
MHNYTVTTFASPTYCGYCGGFLWGLAKQGVRCQKCKTAAHKKCAFEAITQCTGDRGLATLVAARASPMFSVTSPDGSRITLSGNNFSPTEPGSSYVSQLDGMFWQQLDEEVRLNDLVSSQAEQPLSLFQTLPANFMQFTAKLAPLTLVNKAAKEIVLWRRPKHSVAAMAVYSTYCLRPNLLLATPLMLLIGYIVFNYFNSEHYHRHCYSHRGHGSASNDGNLAGGGYSFSQNRRGLSSAASGISSGLLRGRGNAGGSAVRMRRRGSQPSAAAPYPQIKQTSAKHPDAQTMSEQGGTDGVGSPLSFSSSSSSSAADHTTASPDNRHRSPAKSAETAYDSASAVTPSSAKEKRVLVRAPSSSTESAVGSDGRSARAVFLQQRVDLEAALGVASFGSARHTENVHTTQIMTGTYVWAYDWVAAHNHMVDWSRPEETWRILVACVCAQFALLVVVYWVPWYLLFLVGGNSALLSMSPHVRAFAKVYGFELALCLHEWVVLKWLRLRINVSQMPPMRWVLRRRKRRSRAVGHRNRTHTRCRGISKAASGGPSMFQDEGSDWLRGCTATSESNSDDGSEYGAHSGYLTPPPLLSLASSTAGSSAATLVRRPHMVSVFENQRWWLGFGWIPRLGTNERAKWSDESGRQRFASINDFMPGEGYEWAEEDGGGWEADRYWALPVRTDEDGWIYTDNFWRHPSPASSLVSSYTRRRKWVRKVRPKSTHHRQETSPCSAISATP